MRNLVRIAEALGARLSVRLLWHGEGLDRLLDAAHAGLVDQVVELLMKNGWEVVPESTFNRYGERGSIDILAWHPVHGALLVIEVKSVVPDVGALLSGVNRKQRIAPTVAAEHGWRVRSISRLIVLPEDRTVRRRIAMHAATFDLAYPVRTRAVRRWLRDPVGPMAGLLFLPSSQGTTARRRVATGSVPRRAGQSRTGATRRPSAARSRPR